MVIDVLHVRGKNPKLVVGGEDLSHAQLSFMTPERQSFVRHEETMRFGPKIAVSVCVPK